MLTGLLFWRASCQPCDVTVKRMAPLEGTTWEAMTWNCCHCSMNVSSTWWVPCSYTRWPQLLQSVCMELYPPPSPPPTLPPSLPPPIPPTPLLCWPYINAHLKKNRLKSPENRAPGINKVSYMKVSRLLCLLLPVQDGQLQPAACLNWQHILKWYFSKYYPVRGSWVFSDPVTYVHKNCWISMLKTFSTNICMSPTFLQHST